MMKRTSGRASRRSRRSARRLHSSASSELVASSRMRMRAGLSKRARAESTPLCLCPPDRLMPRSPSNVCSTRRGKRVRNSWACAARAAPRASSSSSASGRPCDVFSDHAGEDEGVLLRLLSRTGARRANSLGHPRRRSRCGHRSRRRAAEAARRASSCLRPRADHGDALAGLDLQRDAFEHPVALAERTSRPPRASPLSPVS